MKTLNDLTQYLTLLNLPSFCSNSREGLTRENINSYKEETVLTSPAVNGIATTATHIRNQYLTNFSLDIQYAIDFPRMEGKARIDNDVA
jgi:hypothetical protein